MKILVERLMKIENEDEQKKFFENLITNLSNANIHEITNYLNKESDTKKAIAMNKNLLEAVIKNINDQATSDDWISLFELVLKSNTLNEYSKDIKERIKGIKVVELVNHTKIKDVDPNDLPLEVYELIKNIDQKVATNFSNILFNKKIDMLDAESNEKNFLWMVAVYSFFDHTDIQHKKDMYLATCKRAIEKITIEKINKIFNTYGKELFKKKLFKKACDFLLYAYVESNENIKTICNNFIQGFKFLTKEEKIKYLNENQEYIKIKFSHKIDKENLKPSCMELYELI